MFWIWKFQTLPLTTTKKMPANKNAMPGPSAPKQTAVDLEAKLAAMEEKEAAEAKRRQEQEEKKKKLAKLTEAKKVGVTTFPFHVVTHVRTCQPAMPIHADSHALAFLSDTSPLQSYGLIHAHVSYAYLGISTALYTSTCTQTSSQHQYFTLPPRIRADSARTLGHPRTVLGLSSDSARTH